MEVWCSRDKHIKPGQKRRMRAIWLAKPPKNFQDGPESGEWPYLLDDWLGTVAVKALNNIFPKGVKPGQCVKCTLKRLEVDDA